MIGHVSPHHRRDGITISCGVSDLGRAWGWCSLGEPCTLCSQPCCPWLCTAPLAPALGQAAETAQQPGLQSSAHTGLVCSTSHCIATKYFLSELKIGAQAQRRLFYISCAYECKHCSLKVISTNVLPIAEFPGLMYHEGATPNARSPPCFKANCDMSLV